jgi:hypothetical protein
LALITKARAKVGRNQKAAERRRKRELRFQFTRPRTEWAWIGKIPPGSAVERHGVIARIKAAYVPLVAEAWLEAI